MYNDIIQYLYPILVILAVLLCGYGIWYYINNLSEEEEVLPHEDNRTDWLTFSRMFLIGAVALESVGLFTAMLWAKNAYQGDGVFGTILQSLFVLAFVGFCIGKFYGVPTFLKARRHGDWLLMTIAFFTFSGSTLILLTTGYFELINTSSEAAQARSANSAPVLAVEEDIKHTRERIAALAAFSDPQGVQSEADKNAALEHNTANRRASLESRINSALATRPANQAGQVSGKTLAELTNSCQNASSWYSKKYCGTVTDARQELRQLSGGAGATPYATKHTEYTGLSAHLVELEKRRADLLQGLGGSAMESWSADDRAVAELLGLDVEKAAWLKWLLYAIILDLAGLVFRFLSAMSGNKCGSDPKAEIHKIVGACHDLGFDLNVLKDVIKGTVYSKFNGVGSVSDGSVMTSFTPTATTVDETGQERVSGVIKNVPAYEKGGVLSKDGLFYGHRKEGVLVSEIVEALGEDTIHKLNQLGLSKRRQSSQKPAVPKSQPPTATKVIQPPPPHVLNIHIGKHKWTGEDVVFKPIHWLVGGRSGSGKSNYLNYMLSQLIARSAEDVQLILIDMKNGAEFNRYAQVANLARPVVTNPRAALQVLREVIVEMQRRQKIVGKSIEEFRRNGGKMPYLVVVIDEVAELTNIKKYRIKAIERIGVITRLARSAGVQLVVATQYPRNQIIPSQLTMNLDGRVIFKVGRKEESKVLLEETGAESLDIGECILQAPLAKHIVKVPLIEEAYIDHVVNKFTRPSAVGDQVIDDLATEEEDLSPSFSKTNGVWGPEVKEQVLAMIKDGKSHRAIANETGVGRATVIGWKKEAKASLQPV